MGTGATRTVLALIVCNVVMYVLQELADAISGRGFSALFGLSLAGIKSGFAWQFVSYMFLHGNPLHLFLNMLVLFFIGPETERGMGTRHFLVLYFMSGILGGLGWVLIGSYGLCVGASGAIFGILGAFATMYPQRRITLLLFFVLPITMKAWILVSCLAFIELVAMIGHDGGNVAYAVHVGGIVVGVVYAWITCRPRGRTILPHKPHGWRILRGGRDTSRAPDAVEVDRVLDKIAASGIGSLTSRERQVLEEASRRRGSTR
jgi:membrane associated rhomboid family serine protease